jgi:hypothetical protein
MRPKPEPSDELFLLRTVMNQDPKHDVKADLALAQYRKLMTEKPEWIMQQLRIAEKEHRQEIVAWQNESKAARAEREVAQAKDKVKDVGTEKCLAKLDKLIGELTAK